MDYRRNRLRNHSHPAMSSGARGAGDTVHPPLAKPPPPPPQAWPTTRKAAEKMKEARRLKNIVKKKEQRQRRKERKLEASRKAKEDAERQRLIDDNTSVEELRQLSIEQASAVPCVDDRTKEEPAALIIQGAWRMKMVRARYARVRPLRAAEKQRLIDDDLSLIHI